MTKRRMVFLIVALLLGVLGSVAWKLTARSAYESAEYGVLESDGSFEIREYPDLMLASTGMRDSRGNDGSFMRLFRYISGANEAEQKVAMTIPVFMEEMEEPSQGRMGFVLPKGVASQGVPAPVGEGVQIRKRGGGRFAVARFAGQLDVASAGAAEKRLRDWAKTKGLNVHDEAEVAGYDPPWTPGPLRRNEVLLRLKE